MVAGPQRAGQGVRRHRLRKSPGVFWEGSKGGSRPHGHCVLGLTVMTPQRGCKQWLLPLLRAARAPGAWPAGRCVPVPLPVVSSSPWDAAAARGTGSLFYQSKCKKTENPDIFQCLKTKGSSKHRTKIPTRMCLQMHKGISERDSLLKS